MNLLNFSDIPAKSLLGKTLRRALQLVPNTAVVPILQGRARGLKWIAGSSVKGCWLGSYELVKQIQLANCLKAGHVFYDIGANVGFYTLLASRQVGVNGTVVAFEPLPANISLLRRHIQLNAFRNAHVCDCAVSDIDGSATFDLGANASMGFLSESGSISVQTVRLDTVVDQERYPLPSCIKIDVEGAESGVLRGAEKTIKRGRPVIFLATHGEQVHRECISILGSYGYHCSPLGNDLDLLAVDELVARPGPNQHL